ncbi:ASCH domain-containing protein [Rhodopirellula sp. P2]|uniref:ASCH domain-containing protein n=1 Tax=Rhodopirellula sp. P2 TaxID=2127060 RepID=UPI002367D884|nr:ASCH domain-containing protein [Rhodopirellula sp. P2]WDQ16782.1 ASCH domain-containing protein [Rhodopirellula sp. P2]
MLFLSIHPEYVQAILEGRKTVELRKRRPRAEVGSTVVIYATMPQCEVVATAIVERIQSAEPAKLWRQVRDTAAVSKQAYERYFADTETAVGIHLRHVQRFVEPIPLGDLRKSWEGFHPPQQFRYLTSCQQNFISLRHTENCTPSS